jgi:hypothetical protein
MLSAGRSANAPSSTHGAFFLGGSYMYRKTWHVPESLRGKKISLLFDGVYRHSRVLVNGTEVGGCVSGWTAFEVDVSMAVKYGGMNLVELEVENEGQPGARWYTGSGVHRGVKLVVRGRKGHAVLRKDGIRLVTKILEGVGMVIVDVGVILENALGEEVDVKVRFTKDGHEKGMWEGKTRGREIHGTVEMEDASLWSAEEPFLYDCEVHVGGDVDRFRYGLRTIGWGPKNGLLINGETVKLRDACVHADNGILGACSFKAAEVRRMKLLKASGFNAVRMSHHPASEALLEACDEVGIYVMNEYGDYWFEAKTDHDEARHFQEQWKKDVEAMVAGSRDHACVIMYSLGNEVTEPKSAYGHAMAKLLLDYTRTLDPTRPNTIAINLLLATLLYSKKPPGDPHAPPRASGSATGGLGSSLINVLISLFVGLMDYVPRLPYCNAITSSLFAYMDIAGYSYGSCRYTTDASLHPGRIMLGTETLPRDVARNWAMVERISALIGDFMWTGWDYIGETGLGGFEYDGPWYSPGMVYKNYPYLVGGCGALDITGLPNASAFVAQAAWKKIHGGPIIAVRPLDVSDLRYRTTVWRSSDAIVGWGWKGREGQMAYIEVFSRDEEIELLLNRRSLGKKKIGLDTNYTAHFTTPYEPGLVVAVGYSAGKETSRSSIQSAGASSIRITNESGKTPLKADGQDLAFLRLELQDQDGVVEMGDDDEVEVVVKGPASLAGLGSAKPQTTERFDDNIHWTYRGRALCAVRAGREGGRVEVMVKSKRHGEASVDIVQRLEEM